MAATIKIVVIFLLRIYTHSVLPFLPWSGILVSFLKR